MTDVQTQTHASVVGLDSARLVEFIARTRGIDPAAVDLEVRLLHGGLETNAVARVRARFHDGPTRGGTTTFVVKRLDGPAQREADLYRILLQPAANLAPRLFGFEHIGTDTTYLYLEYIRAARAWPWREMPSTGGVLRGLAALHSAVPETAATAALNTWDYEAELGHRAQWTLATFEAASGGTAELGHLRPYGPALQRLVVDLPRRRAELLKAAPFGSTILHGDVHSRNVLLRSRAGAEFPVLIDWGRARIGSPLEDVSSWLHSLGCWEPEVRRRHDTLLRHYLEARGFPTTLLRSVRDAYWLAAACNSLSGALGYQLRVALDTTGRSTGEHAGAMAAVRQHLRVIRRADALWRT